MQRVMQQQIWFDVGSFVMDVNSWLSYWHLGQCGSAFTGYFWPSTIGYLLNFFLFSSNCYFNYSSVTISICWNSCSSSGSISTTPGKLASLFLIYCYSTLVSLLY